MDDSIVEIEKDIAILMQKLGITKKGYLTGNGIISNIKSINEKLDALTEMKNISAFEIKEIKNSIALINEEFTEMYDKIEKDICDINKNITSIHAAIIDMQSKIKSDVISKDYIFAVMKNIITVAAFITAMGTIAFFIVKAFSQRVPFYFN